MSTWTLRVVPKAYTSFVDGALLSEERARSEGLSHAPRCLQGHTLPLLTIPRTKKPRYLKKGPVCDLYLWVLFARILEPHPQLSEDFS